jgi:plasmid stabilization system protein ParE
MAARRPMANRSARTSDMSNKRIISLPKWHKIIIYQIETDRIVILTIRDTRQEAKD